MAAPAQGKLQIILDGKELDFTSPVQPRPELTSDQAQDVARGCTEGFMKAIEAFHRRADEVTNEYHLRAQDELRRLRNDKDHLRENLQFAVTEAEKLSD